MPTLFRIALPDAHQPARLRTSNRRQAKQARWPSRNRFFLCRQTALARSSGLLFCVSSFSLFFSPPLLLALLGTDTLDCARREDSERTLDSEGDLENTFSEAELGDHRMSVTADLLPGEMAQHRARVSGSYAEAPRHRLVQATQLHAD
jgi:hypothetical protein